jgi:hypothetical protein
LKGRLRNQRALTVRRPHVDCRTGLLTCHLFITFLCYLLLSTFRKVLPAVHSICEEQEKPREQSM